MPKDQAWLLMVISVHTWLVEADTTISGHFLWAEMKIIPFTYPLLFTFIHLDKHLDGARGKIILKHFKWNHLATQKIKFHAWVKKCHFGNFTRNRPIGWIGHALLVQPSMVASASTNRVWTKITIKSYAWSFAIQIQIQAVCGLNKLSSKLDIVHWDSFNLLNA